MQFDDEAVGYLKRVLADARESHQFLESSREFVTYGRLGPLLAACWNVLVLLQHS